jgi:hypothetical protein
MFLKKKKKKKKIEWGDGVGNDAKHPPFEEKNILCIYVYGGFDGIAFVGWAIKLCLWGDPFISSRSWCNGCSFMVQSSSFSCQGQMRGFFMSQCLAPHAITAAPFSCRFNQSFVHDFTVV